MVINKKICPSGLKNNPNRLLKSIDFITIHCTGNRSATATAARHANYQHGGSGGNQTSWHYTIDKDSIWQSFDDKQECWHAGNSTGNSTSLGIEICVNDRAGFKVACENAAWLTAELLTKYILSIEKVVQHNHWSSKNCPAELRNGEWGITWNDFISMVKRHLTASDNDILVIGSATASFQQAEAWSKGIGGTETFISLARKYWDYAPTHGGINPVIAFCQAALETGYGKFKGVLDESYKNPCGMKTTKGGADNDPNAHQSFTSWEEGVKAHLEHLALYAGAVGYPLKNGYDPRHFPYLLGTGKTLKTMSAGWCPGNPNYAAQLKGMMDKVSATALSKFTPYLVKVSTNVLNYRSGAGTNYPVKGQVHKGKVYTIVGEASGIGAVKWGKLKSGAGWISLDFTIKQ